MAGCGKAIQVSVPTRYASKLINYNCGNTGYHGYPEFCRECAVANAGRDWRREAEEAGERFDDDY